MQEASGLFPQSSSPTLFCPRGAATGWTPWCAAPQQSGQEPKSETQHLCVQYALQGPQLQEQGEERKVWGSRFCHTQMTVCGGLFLRKPRRTPTPIPSPAAFPLFPALGTAGDEGLHHRQPPPPPTPTPPLHTGRPQNQLLGPRTNSAAPTTGQGGKGWYRLAFSSTWAKPQACLMQGARAQQPSEDQAPPESATKCLLLLVLLLKDDFFWLSA